MNRPNVSRSWENTASAGLPQIALTKTVPPSTNRRRVERKRLLNRLQDFAAHRLILIKAPAGYGKTTLGVDWYERLRHSGAVAAWLSLDEDDDEPSAFAYHIARTVHRAAPDLGQSALLVETKLIDSKNVLSVAINAIAESDTEVYLCLDDYHLVTDARSHELTAFLLRYAPSNFHVVIMSRTEPPLPIYKLQLADEVAEINVASLRFNLTETKEFLGAEPSPKLAPAEIWKLYDAAEGWPAALQLARISVRNSADPSRIVNSFSGASQKISAYLDDTLSTQADEIVTFLLQTAVLDRLHGSLCEAVTGIPRSGGLLKALNDEQLLLTSVDEENGWYRYHHLMSDFLIDRLQRRMPGRIPELLSVVEFIAGGRSNKQIARTLGVTAGNGKDPPKADFHQAVGRNARASRCSGAKSWHAAEFSAKLIPRPSARLPHLGDTIIEAWGTDCRPTRT